MDIAKLGVAIDPTKAVDGAEKTKAALKDVGSTAEKELKRVDDSAGKASQGLGKVDGASNKASQGLKRVDNAAAKTGQGLKQADTAASQASQGIARVDSAANRANQGLKRVDEAAGRASRELKRVDDAADQASDGLKRVDGAAGRAGRSTLRMGADGRRGLADMSRGIVDFLDGIGLMDTGFGRMVRRSQSMTDSIGRMRGALPGLSNGLRGVTASAGAMGAGAAVVTAGMAAMVAAIVGAIAVIGSLIAALTAAGLAFKAFKAGLPMASFLEDAETGLAVLMGSWEKAEAKLADMNRFAAVTPFDSRQLLTGVRYLEIFTSGLLNNEKGWRLVGDASSAAGQQFDQVAMWVGRTYAALKGGQPIGEATMRLMEMGLITPEIKGRLDSLAESSNKAGKNFAEIWAIAEQSLQRFSGTMELAEQNWSSTTNALAEGWEMMLAAFATPIMDSLKPVLADITQLLNGAIPVAERIGEAIATGIRALHSAISDGSIEQLLSLALMAGIELAAAGLVAAFMLSITNAAKGMAMIFKNTITGIVDFFSSLLTVALDVLSQLFSGNFTAAMVSVGQFFLNLFTGGGKGGIIDTIGRSIYNTLGQTFEDVVNSFYVGFIKVWQKIADLLSAGMTKLGMDPMAPVPLPKPLDFFKPVEGGGLRDIVNAADEFVGSSARDRLMEMLREKGAGINGDKPELPEPVNMEGLLGGTDPAGKGKGKVLKAKEVELLDTQVQKLIKDWMDLDKQMDAVLASVAQSMAMNITDGLTALIDGTKDLKTAFSDMATSIINDIVRMVIQMYVQLAVAQMLAAMGYGGSGGAGVAHSGGLAGSRKLMTNGSMATFHNGGVNTAEAMVKVERGETILTRKRAAELEDQLARHQSGAKQEGGAKTTIINVTDASQVLDVIAANPDAIVNAISRRQPAVRAIVQSKERR